MKRFLLSACLVLASSFAGSSAFAQGSGRCIVADPTGTPLNVRSSPSGRILGALSRGSRASILDLVTDERGREWAFVQPAGPGQRGWVFREFLFCD